jgi:hypothetical protein
MANKKPTNEIQIAVEKKITTWLALGANTPSKEELGVVDRALDYLKIAAKLDEGEWGGELGDLTRSKKGRDDDD